MKIAVTSASGKLGKTIVKELIKTLGVESIIAIARTPEKVKDLGVEVRKGDYNNIDDFNQALKGVDSVLLVSGMDHPDIRIDQHRNVIEAAKLNNVEKIVYTSVVGNEKDTSFGPIIKSNRHTEEDIKNSGLNWVIGRNGIYIEPDLEYIKSYKKEGEIRNCAADGKCAYTTRKELAYAYTKMLLSDSHNGNTYNLVGEAITQKELASILNEVYGTELIFNAISVEDYTSERKSELGEFIGTVIAGIYEGIKNGNNEVLSDYEQASGRKHKSPIEMILDLKNNL